MVDRLMFTCLSCLTIVASLDTENNGIQYEMRHKSILNGIIKLILMLNNKFILSMDTISLL